MPDWFITAQDWLCVSVDLACYNLIFFGICAAVPLLALALLTLWRGERFGRLWLDAFPRVCVHQLALALASGPLFAPILRRLILYIWPSASGSWPLRLFVHWRPSTLFAGLSAAGPNWFQTALFVYLGGCLAIALIKALRALAYRRRLLRASVQCSDDMLNHLKRFLQDELLTEPNRLPQLVISSATDAPCVQLWPKQLIALPESKTGELARPAQLRNLVDYMLNRGGTTGVLNWYNPLYWAFMRLYRREARLANWLRADSRRSDRERAFFNSAIARVPGTGCRIPGGWRLRNIDAAPARRECTRRKRLLTYLAVLLITVLLMTCVDVRLELNDPTDALCLLGTNARFTDPDWWPALDPKLAGAEFGAYAMTVESVDNYSDLVALRYLPDVDLASVTELCQPLEERLTSAFGAPAMVREDGRGKNTSTAARMLRWEAVDKYGREAQFLMSYYERDSYYADETTGGCCVRVRLLYK